MPFSRTLRPGVACLVLIATLLIPVAARAASTTAQMRVVNMAGATLADQSQATGDVTINADPNASCFGPPGGSGSAVNVPGPSALGIVKDAAASNPGLRPLSVTDQFSFGLGVCGIGGFSFNSGDSASWYLKVNHVGAQVGGDQYLLKAGDQVLWYLSPGFPYPNELQLVAPTVANAGKPFTVTVYSWDDTGHRTPLAGALVTGSEAPTGGDGQTLVQLSSGAALQALHGTDIPSNRSIVCVVSSPGACGAPRHKVIGTKGRDRIRGTRWPDVIRSRGGRDRVNSRGGLIDLVKCGRGRDVAIVGPADRTRGCEKVIHKR